MNKYTKLTDQELKDLMKIEHMNASYWLKIYMRDPDKYSEAKELQAIIIATECYKELQRRVA